MTTLIYYPTFEPQSTNWLKYALIYLDEFSPIIPVRGQDQLSDLFRQVEGETTLIKRIEPSWEQGGRATRKVLREAREIQNYPEEYHAIFNNANIISSWRNQKNWNVRLYQEKFSIPFSEFCQDQNFGINVDGDLYLSEELASFFMTFLAEEISYEKQATPITDLPNLDELSTYLRSKKIENKDKVQAAKTIIDLHLPQGIEHIDIEKFINFRTESGITELRQSFKFLVKIRPINDKTIIYGFA
jgi:hypothetical protein